MADKLPVLKTDEIVRALFKLGFRSKRKRGSHLILERSGQVIVVAIHEGRDVPRGTLKRILKQANVSLEEFMKMLWVPKPEPVKTASKTL